MTEQTGLCRTWSETQLLVFSREGSYGIHRNYIQLKLLKDAVSIVIYLKKIFILNVYKSFQTNIVYVGNSLQ